MTSNPTGKGKYLAAPYPCDIIMKGGITSGVVYPGAVCELATKYCFRNIGGTSAGAIAAAITAAAEFRRTNRKEEDGFQILSELPELLGTSSKGTGRSLLFSLFQPQKRTAALYRTVTAALESDWAKLKVPLACLWNFPLATVLGLAPGLLLGYFAAWRPGLMGHLWAAAACLLVTMIGGLVAAALAFLRSALKEIPGNYFGLCTGNDIGTIGGTKPLTPWLADLIDTAAGLDPVAGKPLTFGDLWGDDPDDPKRINLQMMTTNLSFGRPYRLPFDNAKSDGEADDHCFYFNPEEFRMFFPERIVQHLKAKSETVDKGARYLLLPPAKDMPVIVATRMSLSFPVLFSAVPLHAHHYGHKSRGDLQRCWFSDGGIGSNFPVQLFDSPLPRWPTFDINLRDSSAKTLSDLERVYMVRGNADGMQESWVSIEEGPPGGSLVRFLWSMINVMHNCPLRVRQPIQEGVLGGVAVECVHRRREAGEREGCLLPHAPPHRGLQDGRSGDPRPDHHEGRRSYDSGHGQPLRASGAG